MLRRADTSAVAAIRAVNAIIQPPAQTVDVTVGHAFGEAAKQDLAHIRFSVTVSVFEENDFRRRGHEYAAAPRSDRSWKAQPLREDRAAVNLPVTVAIFQETNRAAGLMLGSNSQRIVAHLDHVNPSVLIKRQADG